MRNTPGRCSAVGRAAHISGAIENQAALKNRNSLSVLAPTIWRSPANKAGPPTIPASPPINGTAVNIAVTILSARSSLSLRGFVPTFDATARGYFHTVRLSSILAYAARYTARGGHRRGQRTLRADADVQDDLSSADPN